MSKKKYNTTNVSLVVWTLAASVVSLFSLDYLVLLFRTKNFITIAVVLFASALIVSVFSIVTAFVNGTFTKSVVLIIMEIIGAVNALIGMTLPVRTEPRKIALLSVYTSVTQIGDAMLISGLVFVIFNCSFLCSS